MNQPELLLVGAGKRVFLDDEHVYEVGNDGFELVRKEVDFDLVEGQLNEVVVGLDVVGGFEKSAAYFGSLGADVEVIQQKGFEFWCF